MILVQMISNAFISHVKDIEDYIKDTSKNTFISQKHVEDVKDK